jgi:hypothetical protein
MAAGESLVAGISILAHAAGQSITARQFLTLQSDGFGTFLVAGTQPRTPAEIVRYRRQMRLAQEEQA